MAFKQAMGTLSVVITLIAYARYMRKAARGEIQPHPLSWALWGVVTLIAYLVQRKQNAGPGSWVVLFTWVSCFLIAIYSYYKYKWNFEPSELLFLIAGLAAVLCYSLSKSPWISAVFATAADVIGYYSTIKKGWIEPFKDDWLSFLLNGIKFFVAFPALQSYSIGTYLYPVTIGTMNLGMFAMLVFRQNRVSMPSRNI